MVAKRIIAFYRLIRMRAPLKLRLPSKAQLERMREIEREFHERAFGEELARVNLDLTIEERLQYLAWMRRLAREHGVPPERSAFRLQEPDKQS